MLSSHLYTLPLIAFTVLSNISLYDSFLSLIDSIFCEMFYLMSCFYNFLMTNCEKPKIFHQNNVWNFFKKKLIRDFHFVIIGRKNDNWINPPGFLIHFVVIFPELFFT